jgi:uncharacterized protein YcbK (DUF882 family)
MRHLNEKQKELLKLHPSNLINEVYGMDFKQINKVVKNVKSEGLNDFMQLVNEYRNQHLNALLELQEAKELITEIRNELKK